MSWNNGIKIATRYVVRAPKQQRFPLGHFEYKRSIKLRRVYVPFEAVLSCKISRRNCGSRVSKRIFIPIDNMQKDIVLALNTQCNDNTNISRYKATSSACSLLYKDKKSRKLTILLVENPLAS